MKTTVKSGVVTPLAVFSLMLMVAHPAPAQTQGGGPIVIPEVQHVTSPPLRELVQAAPRLVTPRVIPLRRIPSPQREAVTSQARDLVVQESAGPLVSTTNLLNFDGIAADGFTTPPDTNGSVGATQFVETVNTQFAVYNKSNNALLLGPTNFGTFFTTLGGNCATGNLSDPIVLYDKAAGRWLLSILAYDNTFSSNLECVAVSTSSDATGSYNLYSFSFGTNLNDYPKFGVWPDAYYFSAVMFANGVTFIGPQACAFPRSAMLAGNSASMVCFQRTTSDSVLMPSDLDGSIQPPAGEPNFFMELATNSLNLFKFHVDFTTPSNSTFTGPTNIPVTAYTQACNGGVCIPQSGTAQQLDSLGDRLMFRLAYRNFGGHESLVIDHSVQVNPITGQTGVRWYEVRDPNGTPTIFQQSTFAPDASFRWMGSIAMDKLGDMTMGYSVSSSSLNPQIQYTGRVPTDPLNTMETEASIINGTGSQLTTTRWGDYTSMSIDPVDDCTFWYSNEYLTANGDFNWHTRIASFKFPSCITATRGDFDGDHKADMAVWRPSTGQWFIIPSSNPGTPITQSWGLSGDKLVLGDYDGDGKTDFAVWRPSTGRWFIIPSSNPGTHIVQPWGLASDIPVPGDYDGDGKTDFAVWRPSTGQWLIIPSSNPGTPIVKQWGLPSDIPVPGDYDGDGKTDFAVWRPSTGQWHIIPSGNPGTPITQSWGLASDIPVPADYDGDHRTDIAVWRPSTGQWFIIPSGNPGTPIIESFGLSGDVPVPVDYDGDGKADIAVWRPSTGQWFIIPSATPLSFTMTSWGLPTDLPVQKPIGQ